MFFFFFKQKTAYEMRISDWSSDVCSSDLRLGGIALGNILHRPIGQREGGKPGGVERGELAEADTEAAAGRQLVDALPDRQGSGNILIAQIGGQRVAVDLRFEPGVSGDGLQFGRKDQRASGPAIIERFLADTVADKMQDRQS